MESFAWALTTLPFINNLIWPAVEHFFNTLLSWKDVRKHLALPRNLTLQSPITFNTDFPASLASISLQARTGKVFFNLASLFRDTVLKSFTTLIENSLLVPGALRGQVSYLYISILSETSSPLNRRFGKRIWANHSLMMNDSLYVRRFFINQL